LGADIGGQGCLLMSILSEGETMSKEIQPIQKWDLPAGFQNTGLLTEKIEPQVHPENLATMLRKINELVFAVNELNQQK